MFLMKWRKVDISYMKFGIEIFAIFEVFFTCTECPKNVYTHDSHINRYSVIIFCSDVLE
jgi:hypothetical protein